MSWVAAAIIGGAVVGAGASAYAGSKAASATKSAAKNATQAELQMYNQNHADLAPYRQAGYGALDVLSQLYWLPTGAQATTAPVSAYTAGMSRIGDVNTQAAEQMLAQGWPSSRSPASSCAPRSRSPCARATPSAAS